MLWQQPLAPIIHPKPVSDAMPDLDKDLEVSPDLVGRLDAKDLIQEATGSFQLAAALRQIIEGECHLSMVPQKRTQFLEASFQNCMGRDDSAEPQQGVRIIG